MNESEAVLKKPSNRRSFMKKGMLAAGGAAMGAGLLAKGLPAFAADRDDDQDRDRDDRLTRGDVAILKLLAAAEIIETDLWQQYSELGGTQDTEVSGINGGNPLYAGALKILDLDMPQYVHDNTDDEMSHAAFLNAYLMSKGHHPVDLKPFRILPSSKATGARQIKRLTNLTQLTVDTSWWTRYRSTTNPDLGAMFDQAVPSLNVGQHTAIPRSDADTAGSSLSDNLPSSITTHLQAIAFTAGFHFAFIEQGGTSLYHTLTQKVTSLEVLRILVSIGGSEIMHFQTWQDKAGNALPLTDVDPVTGATVTFVDLTKGQPETLQANLIMPEPCEFINKRLPPCAVIRPTGPGQIDAQGAIHGFIDDGLFFGQSKEFTDLLLHLAEEADEARRER
ncbi:MAG: twin-arginine translocation signal domain-containing protein [Terriglobia bacterium]